jgi:uncharacterized protein YdaL
VAVEVNLYMFLFSFKYFSSKMMEVKLNINPCNIVFLESLDKKEQDQNQMLENL